jgi:dipeptidyl aminopeptidase/acylaminoacyl peptidase
MPKLSSRLAAALVLALASAPPLAAQKHPMTFEDLSLLRAVAEPQLSPDGRQVAYTAVTTDYAADRAKAEVVLADVATGRTRRLTAGSSPRWSPDGRTIAFRGGAGERSGVWLWDVAADSARFLAQVRTTEHFLGHRAVKGFAWSPDGSRIAFTSADAPAPPPASDVRVVTRQLYKTRTGLSDNRLTHIYVVPASGGEPHQVTSGRYDEHSLAWSPDGTRLAFISNRSADPDANYSDDVWTVDVATGRERAVTHSPGTELQPAWSPDGHTIAYLGSVRRVNTKDSSAEDTQLYLVPADGGEPRLMTGALDRRLTELAWEPGGRSLLIAGYDRGGNTVWRADVATARARPVLQGAFTARSATEDSRGAAMAFLRSDLAHPTEVWVARADGTGARQLTHEQDELLARVELPSADTMWVRSPDGAAVQGWLMKPAGWQPGRKYPLVLYIHGGPHGAFGNAFSEAFDLLSARGYAVLFLNPRGSAGYGQHFSDGTLSAWGGGDYADLMAGVDRTLDANPWIDRSRLGVVGHSYGGFMTNWIVGHTNRFRAAVSGASVSNLVSFYGTSLYSDLIEAEFNGQAADNYELLWKWSPVAYVRAARTPVLFLNGEADNDVPIAQAEEMYVALRRQGTPAEMVRYPGEGHSINFTPRHRLDYLQRIAGWLDRWVAGDGSQPAMQPAG